MNNKSHLTNKEAARRYCSVTAPNRKETNDAALAMGSILDEVRHVIVGQDRLLERILTAQLADGHLLIEGVPGLAKTRTVRAFSRVLGGGWKRVQFTPDLVPSDLVGTRIWQPGEGTFSTELGPLATNYLLADEINRAPAKVQSALLEAMEERQVTIGRDTYPLPKPFLVLATQNPVESEGTYPLPEAQTDRFLMRVVVDYPTKDAELEIIRRSLVGIEELRELATTEQLRNWAELRHNVTVPKEVAERIVDVTRLTREPGAVLDDLQDAVTLGAGIRGSLALVACAQARALIHGRNAISIGDVHDLAVDVLAHRIVLSYQAVVDGVTQQDIVSRVVASFDGES